MKETYHLEPGLPPITVIRRKRQRTMRIRVNSEMVIVSGPASIPEKRLIDFVREKSAWIQKSSELRKQRDLQMESLKKKNEGTLLLRGERKPIYAFPVAGIRKARLIEHDHAVVYQYRPPDNLLDNNEQEPCPDPDEIRAFYLSTAKKQLSERYEFWADRLPFQPVKLVVRNQKTKWGSCSRRGTISLNWRLVKCPQTIMDYIIIHEFCHLRHFNHSRAFWDTVAQYYPDVRNARKWIRAGTDEIFSDL
ncbi:MAG: SprT family zinc-dependent metalloprotease [Balneolales bacterium]